MAQRELHDRVHQTMSVMLDELPVFKDGRHANSLRYLCFADLCNEVFVLCIASREAFIRRWEL